ncbi:hypothetical protein VE01_00913 [Pseudogymnoascus verrucosus]|uniref:Uncharacterized protein n=1 Tax=Pseudogymnoascus verrucosus TaxID=342668 RepID=A0A2P2SW21_9PEZI|nr:uncharacterized protein VE01_00913 [Pseudogymnoascus verrucosus]OBU01041.1 hypothetical protein VE01_00913 [Pseudogymnoascus verrucosus]
MAQNPGYGYDAKDPSGRRPYDPRDDYVAPQPSPPPGYDDYSQAPLRCEYNASEKAASCVFDYGDGFMETGDG